MFLHHYKTEEFRWIIKRKQVPYHRLATGLKILRLSGKMMQSGKSVIPLYGRINDFELYPGDA